MSASRSRRVAAIWATRNITDPEPRDRRPLPQARPRQCDRRRAVRSCGANSRAPFRHLSRRPFGDAHHDHRESVAGQISPYFNLLRGSGNMGSRRTSDHQAMVDGLKAAQLEKQVSDAVRADIDAAYQVPLGAVSRHDKRDVAVTLAAQLACGGARGDRVGGACGIHGHQDRHRRACATSTTTSSSTSIEFGRDRAGRSPVPRVHGRRRGDRAGQPDLGCPAGRDAVHASPRPSARSRRFPDAARRRPTGSSSPTAPVRHRLVDHPAVLRRVRPQPATPTACGSLPVRHPGALILRDPFRTARPSTSCQRADHRHRGRAHRSGGGRPARRAGSALVLPLSTLKPIRTWRCTPGADTKASSRWPSPTPPRGRLPRRTTAPWRRRSWPCRRRP